MEIVQDIISYLHSMVGRQLVLDKFSVKELAFCMCLLKGSTTPPANALRKAIFLIDIRNHYYERLKSPRRTGLVEDKPVEPVKEPTVVTRRQAQKTQVASEPEAEAPEVMMKPTRKTQRNEAKAAAAEPSDQQKPPKSQKPDPAEKPQGKKGSVKTSVPKIQLLMNQSLPVSSVPLAPNTGVPLHPDPMKPSYALQCLQVFEAAVNNRSEPEQLGPLRRPVLRKEGWTPYDYGEEHRRLKGGAVAAATAVA